MNPTEAELSAAYEHDYFFGGEYANYFEDRPALELNFKRRLERLRQYFTPQTSLIEVGCSYGFFLNLAKSCVAKVVGYDITSEGIAYAKKEFGLEVYNESFLNYHGEKVDMVCLWDVVEHLPNPGAVMEKIATVVKPGGYVALTTGDIGALVAKMRGDKWRMVHPPTHLFYFDKQSMTKLLARYGFKVVEFRHQTTYRNVDSVFKQLLTRSKDKPMQLAILSFGYKVASVVGATKWNFGLNLFDIMDVVAVKE